MNKLALILGIFLLPLFIHSAVSPKLFHVNSFGVVGVGSAVINGVFPPPAQLSTDTSCSWILPSPRVDEFTPAPEGQESSKTSTQVKITITGSADSKATCTTDLYYLGAYRFGHITYTIQPLVQ